MILFIDNFDSFSFNLVQVFEAAGAKVVVMRNDVSIEALTTLLDTRPDCRAIVVSPGPSDPAHAGVSVAAIRLAARRGLPVLGVCLGLQAIAVAAGGAVIRASRLVHGEASPIIHDGRGLFTGLPLGFAGARYHSLCVDPTRIPAGYEVSAMTADGTIMGLRHVSEPIEGIQFHPESILSSGGMAILANFLRSVGEGDPSVLADLPDFARSGAGVGGAVLTQGSAERP